MVSEAQVLKAAAIDFFRYWRVWVTIERFNSFETYVRRGLTYSEALEVKNDKYAISESITIALQFDHIEQE